MGIREIIRDVLMNWVCVSSVYDQRFLKHMVG
jgi:hypothetical protein